MSMTPTAQEMAEQLVDQLCKVLVGVHPQATGKKMVPIIAEALTAFAHSRELAVWEEAAKICDLKVCSCKERGWDPKEKCFIHKVLCPHGDLVREFRRRATQCLAKEG